MSRNRRHSNQSGPRTILFDQHGRPMKSVKRYQRAAAAAGISLGGGFKGANDGNLMDWALLPLEINQILRNDLCRLRARSRDLARNDDTARRFLHLIKQNVLGHAAIMLRAKNKLVDGTLDTAWNDTIVGEWKLFGQKRRRRGQFESPSADGQLTMREIAWLSLWNRVIDGEVFIQILRGYPHNRHRFAIRFLNPDLLDSGYCLEAGATARKGAKAQSENGNRIDMGIEFDEFDRPVAYHFTDPGNKHEHMRIPANQIIHIFRNEYIGQIRGIPDFAAIMHKAKMLNGVHEAIVVGWRVAAAKMGFFIPKNPEDKFDTGEEDDEGDLVIEADPGTFQVMQDEYDFQSFDPDYPTSSYEMGNKVFMAQLANGLNVSSPTLSNDYSGVNYSSLRQALLEDREGWRCIQAELTDGFYQPLFDEWYDWTANVTGLIAADVTREPAIEWRPRGWPWVDPLKEVNAQIAAVNARLRSRQSVISETTGMDFVDVVDEIAEEERILKAHGLSVIMGSTKGTKSTKEYEEEEEEDEEKENDEDE